MKKTLKPSEIGIITTTPERELTKYTQLWASEHWEIQNLKNNIILSWDLDRRKKLIEALASYRRSALPALTELTYVPMSRELIDLVLNKIKQINESSI